MAALIQAAAIAGLPFVRVRGESAVRFDVPTLKLYFFGSVFSISEAYFLLLVFLLTSLGIMLFTVLYGRIWCGWACPQTVLSDLGRVLRKRVAKFLHRRILRTFVFHAMLLLFSALVSANLLWYFISPYEMLGDIASGTPGPWTVWSWVLFTALIYLDLAFVNQTFCGSVCPYARIQSAFFDDLTLTIGFDRSRGDECLGCEACVSACPAGIDIRDGLQMECINCAECIDACAARMERRARKTLVGYFRGMATAAARGVARPRVIGLSLIFALIAILFVYHASVRLPVDFQVMRDSGSAYHQAHIQGTIMNAYRIVVENRSRQPAGYRLGISGVSDLKMVVRQNPFMVPPDTRMSMSVYIMVERKNLRDRVTRLSFILESTSEREIRIVREAPFLYPDRTEKGVEI